MRDDQIGGARQIKCIKRSDDLMIEWKIKGVEVMYFIRGLTPDQLDTLLKDFGGTLA